MLTKLSFAVVAVMFAFSAVSAADTMVNNGARGQIAFYSQNNGSYGNSMEGNGNWNRSNIPMVNNGSRGMIAFDRNTSNWGVTTTNNGVPNTQTVNNGSRGLIAFDRNDRNTYSAPMYYNNDAQMSNQTQMQYQTQRNMPADVSAPLTQQYNTK